MTENLASLREAMKFNSIDTYIISSFDPHLGENVPDHWRIIRWLTGFTGSSALVVITQSGAYLWTDSRYYLQAQNELSGSGFELVMPSPQFSDHLSWLSEKFVSGNKIGLDGNIFSMEATRKIELICNKKAFSFDFSCDLISDIWTDRPMMPDSIAFDHPVQFCGTDRGEKLSIVRDEMRKKGAGYLLLTSPDDIMWLLNIRGNDVPFTPVIYSYAIVGPDQVLLFAEERQIPLKLASAFDSLGIVILPYEEVQGMISALNGKSSIIVDPRLTSSLLFNSIPAGMKIIEDIPVVAELKAIKNTTESENVRKIMIMDGVALEKFFFWFEKMFGSEDLSELALAEKLNSFRSQNENYLGPSFSTIVAFNSNSALPHYTPSPEHDSKITTDGILLIDSGGQYLGGTTDITRTIPIGKTSMQSKNDYTLVLKGMINLAKAKFPAGTRGFNLDILARKYLWETGLNYGHGTGHGVGYCLSVHEGPQSISPTPASKAMIRDGMLISDEPAVYRENEYGIRIENLILCTIDTTTGFGEFLNFDTLSLCHIDKNLVQLDLLDHDEIIWLNEYHAEVFEKISPYLTAEEKLWLKSRTSQIE